MTPGSHGYGMGRVSGHGYNRIGQTHRPVAMGRMVWIQQQESGLNENIKRWWQGAAAACVAVALAACGGGSSSSDETSVSVRVEGLTASSLTLVDDLGHTAVLSANGAHPFARMAPGTLFTPSIASQPSNQVCRLDAGVRTAARDLELLVRCEAGLLTTSGLRSFVVDQLVMMDTLEDGVVVSARFNGAAMVIQDAGPGGFIFKVPNVNPGVHEVEATVNGRTFRTSLDIQSNPLTVPPKQYLQETAARIRGRINTLLQSSSTLSDEHRVFLETTLEQLQGLDAELDKAPAEDLAFIARHFAANDPSVLAEAMAALAGERVSVQGARERLSRNQASATCYTHAKAFTGGVVQAGVSIGGLAVSLGLLSNFGIGLATAPMSAFLFFDSLNIINRGLDGIDEQCVWPEDLVARVNDVVFNSQRASRFVAASLSLPSARIHPQVDNRLVFNHAESRALSVQIQMTLSDLVADRTLAAAARVVSAYRSIVSQLPEPIKLPGAGTLAEMAQLKRQSFKPARSLQIEGLSSGITGRVESRLDNNGQPTGDFLFVFSAASWVPTSAEPMPFSFRLRETEADYLGPVISATLQVPLTPVAADLAFETNLDTTLSARLTATHATGFAVVTQPSDGTLTLTNPSSGAFTYTPSMGYSGTVAFTYRAFNASATSQTATVVIAVLSDEVSCTLTDNSGSPAGTVSVNRRCYRALLTGADPDEELWIRYVPDLLGDLQFSGRPEDYLSLMEHVYVPVGLSARVSTESASYDPSNNAFTFDKAYGYYNTSDGTAASPSFTYSEQDDDLRQQTQRLRALLVRNPVSGLLMVDNLQRALVQRAYFADAVVRVDRMEHVSLTLQSLSAGVPTYATTVTRCSRPTSLQSGGYVLTGGADWTVERLTFVNKTETSRTASTSVTCPLSDTTLLDSIAPARGLNNLSFDWRNP